MKEQIIQQSNDPRALEQLYRSDPQAFKAAFDRLDALAQQSPLLQFWHYRLQEEASNSRVGTARPLLLLLLLAVCCGILAKLPDLFSLDKEYYFQRNIGFVIFPALMVYYLWVKRNDLRLILSLATALLVAVVFINLVPFSSESDTAGLSSIHLIIVLWGLLGWAYGGGRFRDAVIRISYLKYNGDLVVMSGLMMLAGLLLSGVTIGLFKLLGYSIEEWYGENIIVIGLSVIPLVATHLVDTNPQRVGKISPLIAKIFSPLVVVMLTAYLVALFFSGKDPYNDREFLLIFNALLAGVMALIFFSVTEAGGGTAHRYQSGVLFSLAALAVIVNGVALSAIAFRLSKYGFSPNRLAVTGANLLFFIHLIIILFRCFGCLTGRKAVSTLQQAIVLFLPIYFLWSVFITFLLPLLFSFR